MTNCGPSGDECCCTSPEVQGGTYYRTYDPLTYVVVSPNMSVPKPTLAPDGGPTGEADPATVSSFRLDKYLVTVGRFRQFVKAWNGGAGWTPPAGSGKHTHLNGGRGLANGASLGTYETGWLAPDNSSVTPTSANLSSLCDVPGFATWTASVGANENLPINCVNWYESYAFCIWDGGFLPSEAEWEYAAAGGNRQRAFPWGSTEPGTNNEYAIYGCSYPSGLPDASSSSCAGTSSIAPVGTAVRGAGRWGQVDLDGDAYQWNLDWYAPYVNPCVDCAYLLDAPNRVLRETTFGAAILPSSARLFYPPSDHVAADGLRCARTP
jgi:formylglycine-generating enzyme required for sulfatase activity